MEQGTKKLSKPSKHKLFPVFLLLEVLFVFGPLVGLILMGLVLGIPYTIVEAGYGKFDNWFILPIVFGAIFGLVGLVCLVLYLLNKKIIYSGKIVRVMLFVGLISLICAPVAMRSIFGGYSSWVSSEDLIYLIPIASALHLAYLGRSYLFNHGNDS